MPFVIKCPGCKQKVKWLVDDPPDDCPACGYCLVSDRADDDVVMPNILSFANRCADGVYKAMEKASQERVYQAAEMAGCSPSEMSGLKITNMRDKMRPGDIAAVPEVNDITRHMDRIKALNPNAQVGYGADSSAGAEYAVGAAQGRIADGVPGSIMPRRGAQITQFYSQSHAARADAVLQGSYTQKGF